MSMSERVRARLTDANFMTTIARDRASRMIVLATVVAAILAVAAGCGGDDDDTAAETTTTEAESTAPVEDSVQQAANDTVSSCIDAVGSASPSPLGVDACESVGELLDREIADMSESAREDVDAALKQLSAKCPGMVADLPEATQEIGLTACHQLATGG